MSRRRRGSADSAAPAAPRDRRAAARLLRDAVGLLTLEGAMFPALEAARRLDVEVGDPAWTLAALAREAAGGDRDEYQLARAAALLEGGWSPDEEDRRRTSLVRVPRCRGPVGRWGRCARPIDHPVGCAAHPAEGDAVRSVGADHVLLVVAPADRPTIAAGESGAAGDRAYVRRDDHARGLWLETGAPGRRQHSVLLRWDQIRRLATDLGIELAEHRAREAYRAAPRGGRPRAHETVAPDGATKTTPQRSSES